MFAASARFVAVVAVPVTSPVILPTKSLVIVEGSLSLLIVPVVMFAALSRLVAVVAVPVTLPVTSPERFPLNVVAVTELLIPSIVTEAGPTVRIPVTLASPSTYNLYPSFAVVPIPTFLVVLIPTRSVVQVPPALTTLSTLSTFSHCPLTELYCSI